MTDDTRVRAAWLYHVGGLSQDEVSRRLGVSRFKVLRLLADARAAGEVRVTLDHASGRTLALAEAVRVRHGLADTLVAPATGGDDAAARHAVGRVAAGWFREAVARGPLVVGMGWGRTLAAMADALDGLRNPDLAVVSLMGAMVRTGPEGPTEVCARIAARAGGRSSFLPAPFLCDTAADAAVVMRQRLVVEALDAARGARHMVISVGEGGADALLSTAGVLNAADVAALAGAGVVADTVGKFFRADGALADVDLNDRTPSIGLDDLRRVEVTMLAAGAAKARAVRAAMRAGIVDRLIVDESLAAALLQEETA